MVGRFDQTVKLWDSSLIVVERYYELVYDDIEQEYCFANQNLKLQKSVSEL